jgi:muramoyltetrapeptide carboxypeptidase
LRAGDTIAFVAPAGVLDKQRIELAAERLRKMGFRTTYRDDVYRERGYLAGTDQTRAAELNEAFRDPQVKAIFPGTGGYGTTRILTSLDYDMIRTHPKIFIGFSDITALHLAISQRTGLITFHSPNPMWGLGSPEDLTPLSAHWFWRAILADRYEGQSCGYLISALAWSPAADETALRGMCAIPPPVTLVGGRASGRLTGGNLSLVAALMGTPFEIETRNRILFLEDIGEAPYRVDRMLCTLKLAGKFQDLAGAVLGQFTRREEEDTSAETVTIDEVLDEYFKPLGVPVIKNFPCGHHRCNATLPIGCRVEIDAVQGSVRLLENPVQLTAP